MHMHNGNSFFCRVFTMENKQRNCVVCFYTYKKEKLHNNKYIFTKIFSDYTLNIK